MSKVQNNKKSGKTEEKIRLARIFDANGVLVTVIMPLFLMIGIITVTILTAYTINKNNYMQEHKYDNIEDGYVMIPSGSTIKKSELEKYISEHVEVVYTEEEKLKLYKMLEEQGVELESTSESTEESSSVDDVDSANYKEFLETNGLVTDEIEEVSKGDKISMLNGKPIKSYSNLYNAEKDFGSKLGLYFNVDNLENYEMINAFIIDNSVLQCVYAVNQDGTALNDNIEESDIRTLTIKLSLDMKAEELIEVYNKPKYEEIKTLDNVKIKYCGNEKGMANLIYFNRTDGRSYCLYSADGLTLEVAHNVVYELFSNLYRLENGGVN